MSHSKTQTLPQRIYIFQEFWLFCSRIVAFTFDLCDLLCFVCNSRTTAKRIEIILWPITAPDQILDRFYVINMAFLSLRKRHLLCETSLASRSEERSLYLQASSCYNKHLFQFLDPPYYYSYQYFTYVSLYHYVIYYRYTYWQWQQ